MIIYDSIYFIILPIQYIFVKNDQPSYTRSYIYKEIKTVNTYLLNNRSSLDRKINYQYNILRNFY